MPSWANIKSEIVGRNKDYDAVRRERIRAVEELTHRPLVIYATAFLKREKVANGAQVGIDADDRLGFDEVIEDISGDSLDVLIHSPGGSPEAAESIVHLLRARFSHLRFIVPDMAKSAATMICCAGDEILLDDRSELGPIDPQIQLIRGDGVTIWAPAQAILRQFDKAKESLADNPKQMAAWLPILQPLGPSLIAECEAANRLAHTLAETWLKEYMFRGETNAEEHANRVTAYLADSVTHLSHARRIGLEQLVQYGFVVTDTRETPTLRDAIKALYLAIHWTLEDTNAFKIIENGRGGAYIRQLIVQQIAIPFPTGPPSALPSPAPPGGLPRRGRRGR